MGMAVLRLLVTTLSASLGFAGNLCSATKVDLSVEEKLQQIVLPKVDFIDVPLNDCLQFFAKESQTLDPSPINKGISITDLTRNSDEILITLRLTEVSLHEAIRYTCQLASCRFSFNDRGVDVREMEQLPKTQVARDLSALEAKLEFIIVPAIEFEEAPLSEVLGLLHETAMQLDPETNPEKKGINLIVESGISSPEPKITLKLTNVSLKEAFEYTAKLSVLECELAPDLLILKSVN